jgi:hypothetical protein
MHYYVNDQIMALVSQVDLRQSRGPHLSLGALGQESNIVRILKYW